MELDGVRAVSSGSGRSGWLNEVVESFPVAVLVRAQRFDREVRIEYRVRGLRVAGFCVDPSCSRDEGQGRVGGCGSSRERLRDDVEKSAFFAVERVERVDGFEPAARLCVEEEEERTARRPAERSRDASFAAVVERVMRFAFLECSLVAVAR
jgi:hypothetical protein